MHVDYIAHVLAKYKNGCATQSLSLSLMRPTPASLRSECASLCRRRFSKKDEQILALFFDPHDSQKAYTDAIINLPAEKFKALQNFLNGKTDYPDDKVVELTAWLVDVQPRPYRSDFDYTKIELSNNCIPDESSISPGDMERTQEINQLQADQGQLGIVNRSKNETAYKPLLFNRRPLFVAGLMLILMISAITALWWDSVHTGNCMYWDSDHYELVACDKKMPGILVIASDNNMLRNFKKITKEDTITAAALGHVWYSKINNLVEYFTADGYHPVQIHYHLKPLTQYMIAHHLQQQP